MLASSAEANKSHSVVLYDKLSAYLKAFDGLLESGIIKRNASVAIAAPKVVVMLFEAIREFVKARANLVRNAYLFEDSDILVDCASSHAWLGH